MAYLAIGIFGVVWPGHWDEAGAIDQIMWGVLMIGGAIVLVAGLRLIDSAPKTGAALVSIGAIVGALPIFWALIPLVLAAGIVILSVMYARRQPEPT